MGAPEGYGRGPVGASPARELTHTTTTSSAEYTGGEFRPDVNYREGVTRLNVMNSPLKPPSHKNDESVDRQGRRDEQAYLRTAAKYQQHWSAPWYHKRITQGAGPPFETCDDRADRGRRHMPAQGGLGSWNPITRQWEIPPQQAEHYERERWINTKYGEAMYGPVSYGKYDPILHQWVAPPEPGAHALRQREHSRHLGIDFDVRHTTVQPAMGTHAPYDIITTLGPDGEEHPSTAAGKPTSLPGREKTGIRVNCGPQHAQFDPIKCDWVVPPNEGEQEHSAAEMRAKGLLPTKRPVPLPPDVGVYDPVVNRWLVPPRNPRIVEGLTFSPRTASR